MAENGKARSKVPGAARDDRNYQLAPGPSYSCCEPHHEDMTARVLAATIHQRAGWRVSVVCSEGHLNIFADTVRIVDQPETKDSTKDSIDAWAIGVAAAEDPSDRHGSGGFGGGGTGPL